MTATHIENRLLALGDATRNLVGSRARAWEGRALLSPTLAILLLQRAAKDGGHAARDDLGGCRRSCGVRHRREHLVLRVRIVLSTVLDRAVVLGLQRPAEVG